MVRRWLELRRRSGAGEHLCRAAGSSRHCWCRAEMVIRCRGNLHRTGAAAGRWAEAVDGHAYRAAAGGASEPLIEGNAGAASRRGRRAHGRAVAALARRPRLIRLGVGHISCSHSRSYISSSAIYDVSAIRARACAIKSITSHSQVLPISATQSAATTPNSAARRSTAPRDGQHPRASSESELVALRACADIPGTIIAERAKGRRAARGAVGRPAGPARPGAQRERRRRRRTTDPAAPVARRAGRRAARGTVGRPAGPAPPLLLGQGDDDGRRAELLADARPRGNGGAVGRASAGRRACGAVGRPAGPAAPVARLGGAVG